MSKPRVYVSRVIPAAGLDRVQAACETEVWPERLPPPYDLLREKVRGVDGLLCLLTDRIDGQLMDAAGPQLRVISQIAVGYDNIDLAAARQRGIPVGHTPGVLTEATADLAFTLLLAGARRIVEGVQYIRDGKWDTWEPETLLGADLSGATLGIIGLGRIGQAMAQRARGFNLGGPPSDVGRFAAIARDALPGAEIEVVDDPLPFPAGFDDSALRANFDTVYETPLDEGIATTIAHIQRLGDVI